MFFVDDLSIIRILKRRLRILSAYLADQMFYKSVFDLPVAVNIVRSNAGLSAVEKFSKDDPACGKLQIAFAIHNTGAFAAEFKRDRCEELTCL